MGFEEQEDPTAPSGKVFESAESYTNRLEGLMLLYGAIMQVRQRSTTPRRTVAACVYSAEAVSAAQAVRCCRPALCVTAAQVLCFSSSGWLGRSVPHASLAL